MVIHHVSSCQSFPPYGNTILNDALIIVTDILEGSREQVDVLPST